ncbi:MAG: hypothetical protein J6V01_02880, partial [Clostridia bacterium]|nr:hypothetical protein [Clostridia bacterium]
MFYRIPTDPRPEVSLTGHIRYREGWSDELCHRANVLLFIRSGTFRYEFEDGSNSIDTDRFVWFKAGSAGSALEDGMIRTRIFGNE